MRISSFRNPASVTPLSLAGDCVCVSLVVILRVTVLPVAMAAALADFLGKTLSQEKQRSRGVPRASIAAK
jgi:hypothetical protein